MSSYEISTFVLIQCKIVTENFRKEIRIDAVAPLVCLWAHAHLPRFKEGLIGDLAMGGLAEPKEVARTTTFLSSDASGYINGQTLVVDGGWQSAVEE